MDWLSDWASELDWFAFVSHPDLHRRHRLADQLVRALDAVLAGPLPRASGSPGCASSPASCRASCRRCPAILQGGIGWQGIVPARAAKMGSIAVDKAIAKLGTPAEFYQQLEPEKIAEHIVSVFRPEIPELVDEVMRREHPRLWRDLPHAGQARRSIERVQAQLPTVVGTGHRRDRRPHRPAARPEDHGDRPLPGEPRAGGADLPRLRPARAQPDGGRSGSSSGSCSASRSRSSTASSTCGGCCRSSASSSAGPPTPSACG